MQKYDVDPYSRKDDAIPDGVRDRDAEEAEQLEDDTLVPAPSWWKNDKKEQNAITNMTIKLPLKKVGLIEDPASRVDSYGEPLRISRLATTTKKLEGISASSRERKSTWQKMSSEAKKIKTKKKRERAQAKKAAAKAAARCRRCCNNRG